MKKYQSHMILCVAVILLSSAFLVHPSIVHAQGAAIAKAATNSVLAGLTDSVNEIIANVILALQTVTSWLIALTGSLLNFSINLTLHIKDFVNGTPAIFTVWRAIRDITGLFIIFALLYSAIMLITGLRSPGFGNLIKNIVVAGILINFSFFVTGLGIDVSNVISVQLYNAIAPANALNVNGLNPSNIQSSWKDGGLSDIFMKSLRITSLYGKNGTGAAGAQASTLSPIKITLIGITSIIIMITAALSFFFAAVAFIIRFILLLFLLAFSPVWFASLVVPQIGDYAKEWWNMYKGQLLFMPVYLLLMYLALSVLTASQGFFSGGFNTTLVAGGDWYSQFMVIGVNAVIVIFMLNAPLLAAIKIGGSATKWFDAKKYGALGIWKGFGSQAGSRTLGRAASRLNERITPKISTWSPTIGALTDKGLSSVSKAGFGVKKGGYDDRLAAKKKAEEAMHKKIGEMVTARGGTKEEGAELQRKYRQALPWKYSLVGFMLDNRAHTETANKLNKKIKDDKMKKDLPVLKRTIDELQKKRDSIANEKPSLALPAGLARQVEEGKQARLKAVDDEIKALQDKIDTAEELKEKDRDSSIMNRLDELKEENKKDGGGGGEKKPEKT